MLILGREEVEALLDPAALIDALAVAMADLSAGRASVPPRTLATVPGAGLLAAMPAYLPSQGVLAAKLVAVFQDNPAAGLEAHHGMVGVFDPETGVPLALMDAAAITALRTAAGSALATRLCARRDAAVLAIVGTGVQARAHARALPLVRDFREVLVAGRTPEHVERLASEIGGRAAGSCEEAVSAADVVCACTNAREPVVRRAWLRPGAHVNSVGYTEGLEIEPAVFGDSLIVVESRESAIGMFPHGASDLTAAIDRGLLESADVRELGELVAGAKSGRTDDEQLTVYRSVGVAAQDAAAGGLVLRAARARGLGTEVRL
jgi:ornithine cyclodeaminase